MKVSHLALLRLMGCWTGSVREENLVAMMALYSEHHWEFGTEENLADCWACLMAVMKAGYWAYLMAEMMAYYWAVRWAC